jgi:outer membrane protein
MKKYIFPALFGAIAISLASASQVQAQMKVGTVDMQKVFGTYYKTRDAEDKLKEAEKAYKDELDSRMEIYKKGADVANKLNDDINKPDTDISSKARKAQDRDSKIQELKGLEKDITEFRQSREKQIQDQMKRMRDGIVDEIMKIVIDQVKSQNYDFVFDKSGYSANNIVSVVLYAKDSYDFSDAVIAKLNATRPAAAPTPSATQKPSAPGAPTSSNTPATTTKPGTSLLHKP